MLFPKPEIHLHVPFLYWGEQVLASSGPALAAVPFPLTELYVLYLTGNDPRLCSAMNDFCSRDIRDVHSTLSLLTESFVGHPWVFSLLPLAHRQGHSDVIARQAGHITSTCGFLWHVAPLSTMTQF